VAQFDEQVSEDGSCIIMIGGDVDLAVVDELLACARNNLAVANAVELDLADVSFIDSTGLGALVLIRQEAAALAKPLTLRNVPPSVVRLLQITGLGDVFDVESPTIVDTA
jgi:anti-anti-sigma factor